ncbi:sugar transferase [Vibrio parahaemolyticus]|nr:sugar transferase [Vibrio parahaemolyticus]
MKTIFDCLVSALALILLAPLLFVVAIIIFVDDPGSPFFKQKRVGLGGREFGMYKFRSMKCNASEVGPYFTQQNDPRITRVGRVIRRTSIDELPQLINVLLGDMSIVGPRPDVPVQEKTIRQMSGNYVIASNRESRVWLKLRCVQIRHQKREPD